MKILIKIHRSPAQLFLIDLVEKRAIKTTMNLINKRAFSRAIMTAFSQSSSTKTLTRDSLPHVNADIVLTEKNIYFNLIQKYKKEAT